MPIPTALDVLIAMVDEGFERKAWHGPTLRGSLRGVTARQAAWRPAPRRHNIWELTVHAAYWKYAVRRRLERISEVRSGPRSAEALRDEERQLAKRGSFSIAGSNWFDVRGRSWPDDVQLLIEEHRRLREAIVALAPGALDRRVAERNHSAAYTIRGIAAHDLYHAGQIQLLKRLQH